MIYWIFHTVTGGFTFATVVILICIAVGYFFPSTRKYGLVISGLVLSVASIYAKGSRDRAKLEQERKDAAVARANKQYDEIEKRPDTPSDAVRRLRDGSF